MDTSEQYGQLGLEQTSNEDRGNSWNGMLDNVLKSRKINAIHCQTESVHDPFNFAGIHLTK
jgi:hypothetical protein